MKLIQNWLKNESKLSFLGWPHQNVYCWPNFKTPSLITIVLKFREIFPKLKVRIDLENIWHLEGNVTSISSLLLWTLSLLRLFNATLKQLTLNRWSITNFPLKLIYLSQNFWAFSRKFKISDLSIWQDITTLHYSFKTMRSSLPDSRMWTQSVPKSDKNL